MKDNQRVNQQISILVIDAKAHRRSVTARVIQKAGFEVFEATTGREGLGLAKEERPDIVLLEANLPDTSGLEVCRQLTNDPDLSGSYVLLCADTDHQADDLAADADDFMIRPVSERELLVRVQALLRIKKAEDALRQAEKRCQFMFEVSNDMLFLLDEAYNICACNRKALETYGYSEPDIMALNIRDLHPAQFIDGTLKQLAEVIRHGETVFETQHQRQDGTRFPVEVSVKPFSLHHQPHFIYAARDIKPHVQTRAVLKEQTAYISAIVSNVVDAIITADEQGTIETFNAAAESLFGYTTAEAIGQNVNLLMPSPYREAHSGYMAHYLKTGQKKIIDSVREAVGQRKDGTVFPLELAVSEMYVAERRMFVGIMRDITERKHAASALEKAKEAAEAAAQAKSEFLANMSHEIRTPMNAVIGMTGLLLDTELSPLQQDFVETIRNSGDALLSIINNILDFSKIEAGKLELEKQPFDLRSCVEEALDLVTGPAAEKQLELACLVDEHIPHTIIGDITRLRQVLVNLLNNAVKFTEWGEVVVSVTGQPISENDDQALTTTDPEMTAAKDQQYELHFSVKDTGIGIPKDRMDRLFRSFSQVDSSTTRHYGGSGLGLAICKRLAESMDGAIWVESEGLPGQGSTFHFTIVVEAAPARVRPYFDSSQSQLTGKRLLIVDDNATNRQILTLQTRRWGMVPLAVASGVEALAWIRKGQPFDLAVLDMQMPEMNGLSLATEIRKHCDKQALPLLMLSSIFQAIDPETAVVNGVAACLNKPVKASALYDVLNGIFNGRDRDIQRPRSQTKVVPQLAGQLPLQILLAEDNLVNQKVALRLLEQMGYRADVAANGLEVLAAVQRQRYDVILMDVQMPEMDGCETTKHLCQQWDKAQRPYIIAMTAGVMENDRARCLAAGMDDYISKPVRVEELVKALHEASLSSAAAIDHADLSAPSLPSSTASDPTAGMPTNGKSPAINPKIFEQLQVDMGEDDRAFMAELVGHFVDGTPPLLAQIRQGLATEDVGSLERAVHTLKGKSAMFGATTLCNLCHELEFAVTAENFQRASEMVDQIEAESVRVESVLVEKFAIKR